MLYFANHAIFIFVFFGVIGGHPIYKEVTSTTENYKDELFKAVATIYRILRKHDPEYESVSESLKLQERQLSRRSPSFQKLDVSIGGKVVHKANDFPIASREILDENTDKLPSLHRAEKFQRPKKKFKMHQFDSKGSHSGEKMFLHPRNKVEGKSEHKKFHPNHHIHNSSKKLLETPRSVKPGRETDYDVTRVENATKILDFSTRSFKMALRNKNLGLDESTTEHQMKKGQHISKNYSSKRDESSTFLLNKSNSSKDFLVPRDSVKTKTENNGSSQTISFVDGNETSISETGKFLVLTEVIADDNNTEQENSTKKRKESILEDFLSLIAYHKAVRFLKQTFIYSSSSLNVILLTLGVLVVLSITLLVILYRIRKRRSKDYVELGYKSGSKNKRNRKGYNCSAYFASLTNSVDKGGSKFSIGSESSSEEEEVAKCKSKNSASKKSELPENYCNFSRKENEALQEKRRSQKGSENPCSKLSRLHRNVSTRSGNVSYRDALKKHKLSKRESLQKTASPERENLAYGSPNKAHSEDIDCSSTNNDFSDTSVKSGHSTKKDVAVFSAAENEIGHGESEEEMDLNNPFHNETFGLDEE